MVKRVHRHVQLLYKVLPDRKVVEKGVCFRLSLQVHKHLFEELYVVLEDHLALSLVLFARIESREVYHGPVHVDYLAIDNCLI